MTTAPAFRYAHGGNISPERRTVLDEFYRVAFRKKLYRGIDDLQADLGAWLKEYNDMRTHQGRWCFGKTPMQTFIDTLPPAKEKSLQAA
jgi:hypothetical protein